MTPSTCCSRSAGLRLRLSQHGGVVLVVELTGSFEMILPLMVTCVTAHVVAQALGGRPIYEVLFERSERLAGRTPPVRSAVTSSPVGIDDPPRSETR